MGLRELKKEQTRQLIADTAWQLFTDSGFDHVTVAEVARSAQVAETTVFNYFRTKEDLLYSGLETFGVALVDAIRTRAPGESALAAFRRFLLNAQGLPDQVEAGDTRALEQARALNQVIAASPRLLAHEQQTIIRITDSLAALLAAETDAPADDLVAHVAANALMGVHRTLLEYVRRRVLSDDEPTHLASDLRRLGTHAFALLEHGLSGYAIKSP
jgi:AcrR family transcriptional regulator